MSPETDEVFRDEIKESRKGGYFVEYTPVPEKQPFAFLGLTFTTGLTPSQLPSLMEKELRLWIARFRVPLYVSSFDSTGDLIHLEPHSHLIGYLDPNDELVKGWGTIKASDLPADQVTRPYLAKVYRNIPFRFAADVREKVRRQNRFTVRAGFIILLFTVVVPVALEAVSLGIDWIAYVLSGFSITRGIYEIGKAFGLLKPSRRAKEESEKKAKMEHYYYHCEKNPAAFDRLKIENFVAEEKQAIQQEDAALRRPAN